MNLALPVSASDHSIGPTDALVTVVNYGDYQSSDCQHRHGVLEKMFDELLDRVRFVYRHFPLVKVHPQALRAAEAAEAAAAQDKFWEMHRQLYKHPEKLEDKHLHRYARDIGLDLKRFDCEMADSIYRDQILKDYRNSMIYGITGAPTTFVNGELYAKSGAELLEAVRALAQK